MLTADRVEEVDVGYVEEGLGPNVDEEVVEEDREDDLEQVDVDDDREDDEVGEVNVGGCCHRCCRLGQMGSC